ncbi:metallopeptidase family protein [Pikeienuella piscinae]|uniref:Metallopeptidase family protein n=1 Tax=Pikeienuella piscinae TaxID=2748098 RepID=A0A7L5BTR7_9RHOB|nr:metallopeptidase family protein [Pikeienuella piscinae]QIE54882.1 metallopeptidase family protein [Pikeienuella piscinae]
MDDLVAPGLDAFEKMAERAFAALPEEFRTRCSGVLIRVADFADRDTLDEMRIEDPFELTGLYCGVDLTRKSHDDFATPPDEVWLYRRPILDEWAERGDVGLFELVNHVLVHEIGHHFGLTDDEIHLIESRGG